MRACNAQRTNRIIEIAAQRVSARALDMATPPPPRCHETHVVERVCYDERARRLRWHIASPRRNADADNFLAAEDATVHRRCTANRARAPLDVELPADVTSYRDGVERLVATLSALPLVIAVQPYVGVRGGTRRVVQWPERNDEPTMLLCTVASSSERRTGDDDNRSASGVEPDR